MNKVIVLGPPLTGKTTLVKKLRTLVGTPVLDFDEELTKRNNGNYPANYPVLNEKLKSEVIADVFEKDEVVFFAFEIAEDKLQEMRNAGFTIVQLTASIETLRQRNQIRLQEEPDNDAFQYMTVNMKYQNSIKERGLVDVQIDTERTVDEVLNEIKTLLSN